MNLSDEILKEHSKAQCIRIVSLVGKSDKKFAELFSLFIGDDLLISQRASWPLSHIVIAYPRLLAKHFAAFLQNLKRSGMHNAIRRNSIKILEEIQIPEKYHGEVMDLCFRFLEAPKEHVAVKALCITVLSKLSKIYPGILPEIKLLLESQLPSQTAAFKSRATKILNG